MELYYYTFLYKGEIVKDGVYPKKYTQEASYVSSGGDTIPLVGHKLYCDNYVILTTMDPIIEEHELEQGYVSLQEVLDWVKESSRKRKAWGTIKDADDA